MDTKALEEIGLTHGEIKVYLALLKIGQSTTGALAKESGVSRSKIYFILDKLTKKGLAGHSMKGEVAYYNAMEPKRILDYIDERNKKLDEQKELVKQMLPQLEAQQSSSEEKPETTVYEGMKAIQNFYLNILDELKSGESYHVLGATYGDDRPGVREFFERYHTQRAKKNIKVKMLANNDVRKHLMKSTFLKSDIRFLPQYLASNMIVVFYKKKSFLFFLSSHPVGFLIQNEEVTKGFKTYFDTFWKIARK